MKIYWSGERKNIIGEKVRLLRKQQGLTQRALAERLQLAGFDMTDLTVLRIESGDRFVPELTLPNFSCYLIKLKRK